MTHIHGPAGSRSPSGLLLGCLELLVALAWGVSGAEAGGEGGTREAAGQAGRGPCATLESGGDENRAELSQGTQKTGLGT